MSGLEFVKAGERYEVRLGNVLLGQVWREERHRYARTRGHRTVVWRRQGVWAEVPEAAADLTRHSAAAELEREARWRRVLR